MWCGGRVSRDPQRAVTVIEPPFRSTCADPTPVQVRGTVRHEAAPSPLGVQQPGALTDLQDHGPGEHPRPDGEAPRDRLLGADAVGRDPRQRRLDDHRRPGAPATSGARGDARAPAALPRPPRARRCPRSRRGAPGCRPRRRPPARSPGVVDRGPAGAGVELEPPRRASSWSGIQSPVKTTMSHGTNRGRPGPRVRDLDARPAAAAPGDPASRRSRSSTGTRQRTAAPNRNAA